MAASSIEPWLYSTAPRTNWEAPGVAVVSPGDFWIRLGLGDGEHVSSMLPLVEVPDVVRFVPGQETTVRVRVPASVDVQLYVELEGVNLESKPKTKRLYIAALTDHPRRPPRWLGREALWDRHRIEVHLERLAADTQALRVRFPGYDSVDVPLDLPFGASPGTVIRRSVVLRRSVGREHD